MPCDWEIGGQLGEISSPVTLESWVWTVAVPTVTFGAVRSMLTIGASAEK